MSAPEAVSERIKLFKDNYSDYTAAKYKEFRLRREFIDYFFEALGWDISNKAGSAEAYKDVIHEDSLKVEGANKAPDYAFRIGVTRKFFVEAKAPSINLKEDDASAFQLRRYGWSAKLPLSILTNFREFAVYDCRFKPRKTDRASHARIMYFTIDEYEERWPEISSIFSRSAIMKGAFDRYSEDDSKKRGTAEVDRQFLTDIESWRETLAKNFALRNPKITVRELNSAVQLTIDRIIFLRIAEDRGIEPRGQLHVLASGKGTYEKLGRLFLQADARYNSGLFHFSKDDGAAESLDRFTLDLKLDDAVAKSIVTSLYPPESPYEFSVLPASILGQVYEQFLGKVIRLTARSAVIDEKPDVKKAGGVFYTPVHIVQYIIEHTISPLLTGKTLLEAGGAKKPSSLPLRILDPACGSGSFLIEAYQFLLDWYRDQYLAEGPEKHSKGKTAVLYRSERGDWRLTIAERRRILLTHIYGVDIDAQAVEVTKLSLLLKVLEGESSDAIASQMSLFQVRALPDLGNNIKSGNSIVGDDALEGFFDNSLDADEVDRNNPFDWTSFSFIKKGELFDAVIGNPPYIDSEWMTKHWPHERQYCTRSYPYAKGNWDIFCVFIGKSVDLLKPDGRLSFIVPNKLMTASYANATRQHLINKGTVDHIRDYAAIKVFPVAVYPVVFSFVKQAKPQGATSYEKMFYDNGVASPAPALTVDLKTLFSGGQEWQFDSTDDALFSGAHLIKLGNVATINDAATVSEAYNLAKLLVDDKPRKRDLTFVNSGTIDPFETNWGERPTRYIRKAYTRPVLKFEDFGKYSSSRIRQAAAKKILVANMTKRIEAVYDADGTILAGKSVSVIQTEYDPFVLTAILNSDFIARYYDRRFHGKKLAGGYLQVSPANLKEIPIPKDVSSTTAKRFSKLVTRLIDEKLKFRGARDEHSRTLASRMVANSIREIETLVVGLYGTA